MIDGIERERRRPEMKPRRLNRDARRWRMPRVNTASVALSSPQSGDDLKKVDGPPSIVLLLLYILLLALLTYSFDIYEELQKT